MGWNECIYRKHMDNQHGMFLFSAQLMGGGVNKEMHGVLHNLQAAERSLANIPIF